MNPHLLRRLATALHPRGEAAPPEPSGGEDLRVVARFSSDVISRIGRDGITRYTSPAIRELSGFEPGDRIGRPAIEIVHPDDRETVLDAVRRSAESGGPCTAEYRLRHKDGSLRWVSVNLQAIRDEATAEVVELIAITRDVGLLHETMQALEESERRYRLLAENASDVIGCFDVVGTTLYVSPAVEGLTGYSQEELIGRSAIELVHADDREPMASAMAIVLRTGEPRLLNHRILHRDGHSTWVSVSVRGVRDETGAIAGTVAVTRDVSEQKQVEQELRDRERLYRLLAENATDIIALTDLHGIPSYVSPASEYIFGLPSATLTGRVSQERVHPDDVPATQQAVRDLLDTGKVQTFEYRMRHRDGHYVWVETILRGITDPQTGRMTEMLGVTRDVTRRRETEAALRESETRLRGILQAQPDLIFVFDREHRYVDFYAHHLEDLYTPPDEFMGLRSGDVLPADAASMLDRSLSDVFATGEPRVAEYSLSLTKGDRDFEARIVALSPDRALAVVRNVTDEREMEAALRESEARARAILEAQPDTMYVFDRNGRCLDYYVHDPRELIEGPEGILGHTLPEMVGREPARAYLDALHEVIDHKQQFVGEVEDVLRGPGRISEARVVRLDADRAVVILRDITEQKRAESAHEELEARVSRAEKLESLGALAGGVAHDFNNLLTTILGNASFALEEVSPQRSVRESIEQILVAADRAQALTDQLLAYAGRAEVEKGAVDLSEAVREVAPLLAPVVSGAAVLRWELEKALPPVEGNRAQLQQVVMNLVSNAAHAVGERPGQVRVRTARTRLDADDLARAAVSGDAVPGPCVEFSVQDTGPGIDGETAARIFDPFFGTRETGRGLGLATVAGIVRSHRAALFLDTQPGEGTCMRILLPLSQRAVDVRRDRVPEDDGWRGSGVVLVVDDEDSVRRMIRRCLERAGFQVLSAPDGARGLEVFRERSDAIVAVVLDWRMPGMSGDVVMQRIRDVRKDVPVLLSSAFTDERALREVLAAERTHFLRKPYRAASLVRAVRELIE